MTRSYRRVPSSAEGGAAGADTLPPVSGGSESAHSASSEVSVNTNASSGGTHNNNNNNNHRSLSERFQDKIFAAAWVAVAVLVGWWSNAPHVLFRPTATQANTSLLQVVALLLGVNTVLLLYLTVYLPRVKGLTDSSAWEVYCPAVIPAMTGVGVLAFGLAIRATWPVWGFLAPLVLSTECLGCLFALHFVPF